VREREAEDAGADVLAAADGADEVAAGGGAGESLCRGSENDGFDREVVDAGRAAGTEIWLEALAALAATRAAYDSTAEAPADEMGIGVGLEVALLLMRLDKLPEDDEAVGNAGKAWSEMKLVAWVLVEARACRAETGADKSTEVEDEDKDEDEESVEPEDVAVAVAVDDEDKAFEAVLPRAELSFALPAAFSPLCLP
jgi:hypothetical protein